MVQTAPSSIQHPKDRQILVCLGNRHIVFGSGASLPDRRQLGPGDVVTRLRRVGDERDGVEERIASSLVVDGFEVRRGEEQSFGDVAIIDGEGHSALVEIKAGDRSFAGIDLGQAWTELAPATDQGERREIWAFNLERLTLGIIWSEGKFSPAFEQLSAIDVWEFDSTKGVFERRDVLDEVDHWLQRVEGIYDEVESWAVEFGLATTRDRVVPMSEELMQRFAVPDRDMPILDIVNGAKPVASLVPVGLWLIGFNGMIDIITRESTFRLGATPKLPGPSNLVLIDPRTRSRSEWSKEAFTSALGLVHASE